MMTERTANPVAAEERALVAMVTAAASVQVLALGWSALGFTISSVAALGILALSATGGIAAGRRWSLPGPAIADPDRGPRLVAWLPAVLALGATAAVLAAQSDLAWRRDPIDWDGLYYHIPAIDSWALAGRVHWIGNLGDVPFANYPMAAETASFVVSRALGTARLLDAVNLLAWPLGVVAIAVIARRLGADRPRAWLAAGLLTGAPLLVGQTTSCYVDGVFTHHLLAALALAVLAADAPAGRRVLPAIMLGLALGLVAATKGLAAGFSVVILAPVAVRLATRRDADTAATIRDLALAVAAAILVGGYWYVRAALVTGNPIHPLELRFGQLVIAPGWDVKLMMTVQTPPEVRDLPTWRQLLQAWSPTVAPSTGYDAFYGGLGRIWTVLGLPATIIAAAAAVRRRLVPAFWSLLVPVALLLAASPAPAWSRMTLWLLGLGLPCLAWALTRLSRWTAAGPWLAAAIALAGLGMAARDVAPALRHDRASGLAADGAGYVSSLAYLSADLAAAPEVDDALATGHLARTGWSHVGFLLGGAMAMPPGSRRIDMLDPPPTTLDDPRLGPDVRWLIWDAVKAGPPPATLTAPASRAVQAASGPDVDLWFIERPATP